MADHCPATVGLDLCFEGSGGQVFENKFREQAAKDGVFLERRVEWVRMVAWTGMAVKLLLLGSRRAATQLLVAALSSVALLVLSHLPHSRLPQLRLRYLAVVAVNLFQCAVGCANHGALYAFSLDASSHGKLSLASLANGVSWMVFYTCFSILPFRWLHPMLCVVAALLLLHTGSICHNGNMEHAYQLANQGWARLMANPTPPPCAAFETCSLFQPLLVVLAYAAIGHYLYVVELARRRAFLARWQDRQRHLGASGTPTNTFFATSKQQGMPLESTDADLAVVERIAVQLLTHQANTAADYWLFIALPGICCLRAFMLVAGAAGGGGGGGGGAGGSN